MISRNWLALTGICLASFLGCIDFTIVNTALTLEQASVLTQNFFMAGYTKVMWLLVGSAALNIVIVWLGLQKNTSQLKMG